MDYTVSMYLHKYIEKHKKEKIGTMKMSDYDLSGSETVVAKVLIYAPGKDTGFSRVIAELYVVGKVKGCWLYSSELDTRRRIGTKGVQILGKIKVKDTKTIRQLIKDRDEKTNLLWFEYEDVRHDIYQIERYILKTATELKTDDEVFNDEIKKVRSNAEKALELLKFKYEERIEKKQKIVDDFEAALEKLFIKEKTNESKSNSNS